MREVRQGLKRFWEAGWAIKGPTLAIVASALLATVLSILVTLVLSIRPRIPNEGWVAIATAVYAGVTVVILVVLTAAAWYAKRQVDQATDQLRYVRRQLQSTERSRRLAVLDRLAVWWESDLLRRARRLANKLGIDLHRQLQSYNRRDAEEFYVLMALCNFFEEMGLLVKEGDLEGGTVVDRFSLSIVHYYGLFRIYIDERQKEDEDYFVNFKSLAAAVSLATFSLKAFPTSSSRP